MILKNGKRIDGCSDTVPVGTLNPFLGATAPFGYLICQGQRISKTTYPELYAICGSTFGPETSTEFTLPDLRGQTIAGYKEGDATFGTLGGLIGNKSISYTPRGANSGTAVTLNTVELTHSGGAVQSHTLTVNEMPSHNHQVSYLKQQAGNDYQFCAGVGAWQTTGQKNGNIESTGGGQGHSHGFTQPSKHSFTPTTKSITQPTFTGTADTLNVVQPTVTLNWIVKAVMLIPNQSTVVNDDSDSTVNVYSCDYMNDLLDQMKREAFDFAHPVGSYYETSDSTWTPQAAGWYGTWVADNDGSALVSYKSSGAFNKATGTIVGGESQSYTPAGKNTGTAVTAHTYTPAGKNTGGAVGNHTLTTTEIPSHSHNLFDNKYNYTTGGQPAANAVVLAGSNATSAAVKTDAAGGGGAHNHGFTQPTFTGTQATLSHTVTQPTFTGTAATLSTIQTSKVVYRWHRTA